MGKNKTYKAFVTRPTRIIDLEGEVLDIPSVMPQLASEIRAISSYATFVVRNDTTLESRLALTTTSVPADAGRRAGVTMPEFLEAGRTGKSRKEWLVRYNIVTAYRSWQERIKSGYY